MKYKLLVLTMLSVSLAISSLAFADDHRVRPRPEVRGDRDRGTEVYYAPTPGNPSKSKGRVQRLSMAIAREADKASDMAKTIFATNFDRINDQEVFAVALLTLVKDSAEDFRKAVAGENLYEGRPVRTEQAYQWLNRSFALMERDTYLKAYPQLSGPNSPIDRLERNLRDVREIYNEAQRVGWRMAEVVGLARSLGKETKDVFNFAMKEMNTERELLVVNLLGELKDEATRFVAEASRPTMRDPKAQLFDNYRRLQMKMDSLTRLLEQNRTIRFSPRVQMSWDEVQAVFEDLTYAFISA